MDRIKERPILFSAPMVRALLDGSKTQTRRVVLVQADERTTEAFQGVDGIWRFSYPTARAPVSHADWDVRCPYGQPGDRLWVRETFQYRGSSYDGQGIEDSEWFRCYGQGGAADNWDPEFPCGWEPSLHMSVRQLTDPGEQEGDGITGWVTKRIPGIHMPRWASRITLEIVSVRVERLQDINRGDAMTEGCPFPNMAQGDDPRRWYAELWEYLNGAGSWDVNPWVWVVEFKRLAA